MDSQTMLENINLHHPHRVIKRLLLTSSPSGSWHLSAGHTADSSSESSDWEKSERGEDEVEAVRRCRCFIIFCLLCECFLTFPRCSASRPSLSRCRLAFFSVTTPLAPLTSSWKQIRTLSTDVSSCAVIQRAGLAPLPGSVADCFPESWTACARRSPWTRPGAATCIGSCAGCWLCPIKLGKGSGPLAVTPAAGAPPPSAPPDPDSGLDTQTHTQVNKQDLLEELGQNLHNSTSNWVIFSLDPQFRSKLPQKCRI